MDVVLDSPTARAPFAGIVSVHKGGTNLVAEMMRAFGYEPAGMGVPSRLPPPDSSLPWRERERAFLDSAPPGSCYFTHSLPLFNGDTAEHRPLLEAWQRKRFPLIFNYRDPRAVVSSFVRYVLREGNSREFTPTMFANVHSEILGSISDADARLHVAIECLQQYLTRSFRENLWLLHHPGVLRLRYETLVGADGGGSTEAQTEAVARAMAHLNVTGDPAKYARALYNRGARTFVRGLADGWRAEFSESHLRAFDRLYGDILRSYGYAASDA